MSQAKAAFPPQHQEHQPGREHAMHPAPEYLPRYPGSGRLKACDDGSYFTGQVLHPNGGEIVGG